MLGNVHHLPLKINKWLTCWFVRQYAW